MAFVFPIHFCDGEILNMMVQLIEFVGDAGQPKVLTALTYIGKAKPMGKNKLLTIGSNMLRKDYYNNWNIL